MSPWIEGRGSVVLALPFSSRTSMPLVKLMIAVWMAAVGAPVRAIVTLVSLKSTRLPHGLEAHVFMFKARLVTVYGGVADVLLPLRSTSAPEPFSTMLPSGRSLDTLFATELHRPALSGEKSQ